MEMLGIISAYLRKTGLPPTLFGRLAVKDPRLVGDLHNGRQPRPETIERIEAFIAANPDRRHVGRQHVGGTGR